MLDAADTFYSDVLGKLKAWTASPPKLRDEAAIEPLPPVDEQLVSTSLSSQDGSEPAEAPDLAPSPVPNAEVAADADTNVGDLAPSTDWSGKEDDEAPAAWREFDETDDAERDDLRAGATSSVEAPAQPAAP